MIEKYKVGEYGLENETEGMYARTDNGIIGKILNSNSDEMINGPELLVNNKIYCIERNSIKEIKENIIDLIEVGDYVNGYKIIAINYKENYIIIQNINKFGENGIKVLQEDEIETILTKEQYEQNCYNVRT